MILQKSPKISEPGPSTNSSDDETYLGQVGFGVKISKATLNKITQTAKDPVPFFLRLLGVMFSDETLAESNVQGKNGRRSLNPKVLAAIKGNNIVTRFELHFRS